MGNTAKNDRCRLWIARQKDGQGSYPHPTLQVAKTLRNPRHESTVGTSARPIPKMQI